jgi:hypothetical protein
MKNFTCQDVKIHEGGLILENKNEIENKIENEIDAIVSNCYNFYLNIENNHECCIHSDRCDLTESEFDLFADFRMEILIEEKKVIILIIV